MARAPARLTVEMPPELHRWLRAVSRPAGKTPGQTLVDLAEAYRQARKYAEALDALARGNAGPGMPC